MKEDGNHKDRWPHFGWDRGGIDVNVALLATDASVTIIEGVVAPTVVVIVETPDSLAQRLCKFVGAVH